MPVLYFYFISHTDRRQVFRALEVFHRSFRDQSHVMEIVFEKGRDRREQGKQSQGEEERERETAIWLRVYARQTGVEARPLVIDHRVTVPLPNFKYAHTSQLVTTNYLGRLLALEEAI